VEWLGFLLNIEGPFFYSVDDFSPKKVFTEENTAVLVGRRVKVGKRGKAGEVEEVEKVERVERVGGLVVSKRQGGLG